MLNNLLRFGRTNSFGEIIGKKLLAWPVFGYRVTLPQKNRKQDDLNAFETLILKLMALSSHYSLDELAEDSCLNKSLVNSIVLRLKDKGLIDDNNKVVKNEIEDNERNEKITYETIMIFRDRITGDFLPHIAYLKDQKLEKVLEENKKIWIIPSSEKTKILDITINDVISTIKATKKANRFRDDQRKSLLKDQISISDSREEFYLQTMLVIQKDTADFRITNPFGGGYSLTLEKAFSILLKENLNVQENYTRYREYLGQNSTEASNKVSKRYAFETETNKNLYPQLINALIPDKEYRSIRKIYASIEWALFYYCNQFALQKILALLLLYSSPIEMQNSLGEIAGKLGLSLQTGKTKVRFQFISVGKIDAFKRGSAELDTLIAIVLLLASKDPMATAFVNVIQKYPDFLIRLYRSKNARSSIGHGSSLQLKDILLQDDEFMCDVVSTLLPSIRFDECRQNEGTDDSANIMLLARNYVHSKFGYGLSQEIVENLVNTEIAYKIAKESSNSSVNADSFISLLYSTCQMCFWQILQGMDSVSVGANDIQSEIEEKIHKIGNVSIPEVILNTNTLRVQETMQGRNVTLGASVLTFVYKADSAQLENIVSKNRGFFDNLAEIIAYRSHDNRMIVLSSENLDILRNETYKTISILIDLLNN